MSKLTRRQFVGTAALAAGFAAAVRPVAATMITTDTTGLIAGSVRIPVQGGTIPAYRAMPIIGESFPVCLVVHEIFGIHEHIRDVCRRLAKLGYLAIAPDLLVRQGDVSKLDSIDAIRPVVAKVPDAQVFADLDATLYWALKSAKGNAAQVGITGFCWGGRIVWMYADHNPKIQAGVAWYGRLTGEANALRPRNPIDIAANLTIPVLGLYGGKDTGISLESVEQMRDRLKSSPSQSEIVVYPNASHAFFADYRPSYSEVDAKDGWQRLQAWLKRFGV
ncbi:MAG: dienelactone hydrolase family protein [Thermosynechococcaceae cyanobacterium]